MAEDVRFSIVGLGMGRGRSKVVMDTPGARLVCVCDLQEEKAKAVEIQTAHGIDPLGDACEEIGDLGPAFGIVKGAHDAEGLVEHEVDPGGGAGNLASVHLNAVLTPDGAAPRSSDHNLVHHDATCLDEVVGLAPGGDSCKRKDPVNPLGLGRGLWACFPVLLHPGGGF